MRPEEKLSGSEAERIDLNELTRQMLALDQHGPIVPSVTASELDAMLPEALPMQGRPLEDALEMLKELAANYGRRNRHPGFFGYVCSPGLPTDIIGNVMATALNQNVTGFSSAPAATTVERRLIRWLTGLAGFPQEQAGGLLLSGGSVANLTGLAAALGSCGGQELRQNGLAAVAGDRPFTLYTSSATHFSIERAAVLLGIGRKHVRSVPVDSEWCMSASALENMIRKDIADGFRPFAVVGSAGSTTTGSVDPLDAIAAICRDHEIWFHVDGAYGGGALFAPELRDQLRGIEYADSLSLDLHKWMFLSFDGSALLLRDPSTAHNVFYTWADYVQIPENPPPESFAFFHYGPETSRRDRALPAMLALLHYGAERLGKNILHNVLCAQYLAERVQEHRSLQLVAKPKLSVCCFRFQPESLRDNPDRVDEINTQIRRQLQEDGEFYLSETKLDGRPVLRVCILNPATEERHLQTLVDRVVEIGNGVMSYVP